MSTDALSDVLSAVRLSGSVFFDVTAKSPWVAEAPPAARIANDVTPGAQHVIEYHVVTRGACWISLVGDIAFEPVQLNEGDIAVIPHGDPHVVSSAPGMRAEPDLAAHRRPEDANALPFAIRTGGDGPTDTHLICGFFSCDTRPFNPLLDSLPRFMRFSRDASLGPYSLLDQFIRFATAETGNKRAGSQSILNRLSELMFVEVIRLHMDQLANNNTGWLAGLRDPLVGRALTLLHARPAHGWTLEELASEAAASRSALADRFTQIVGCPPIQYLTQWRMQIAAKRLADPNVKISAAAHEVGYESEAAFSRAFKKFVGRSPNQWRTLFDLARVHANRCSSPPVRWRHRAHPMRPQGAIRTLRQHRRMTESDGKTFLHDQDPDATSSALNFRSAHCRTGLHSYGLSCFDGVQFGPHCAGDRMMQRRDFITLLVGTEAAWPLAARAQEPKKIPRLCFLTVFPAPYSRLSCAMLV